MPSEFENELIAQRKKDQELERQLGSLPDVIGILHDFTANLYWKVKRVVVRKRSITAGNEYFILSHPSYGKLSVNKLGSKLAAFDAWTTEYDSGEL